MRKIKVLDHKSYPFGEAGTLKFNSDCLKIFHQYRQVRKNQLESGGVLLGKYFKDDNVVIVDEATTPFPSDERSRTGFFRSKSHNEHAQKRWHKTDKKTLFWGLWHTHPEAEPTPSKTDFRDWNNVMKTCDYKGDNLIFIIVGTKKTNAWIGVKKRPVGFFSSENYKFEKLESFNV